jgi:small-conductance mechanosensitive channel
MRNEQAHDGRTTFRQKLLAQAQPVLLCIGLWLAGSPGASAQAQPQATPAPVPTADILVQADQDQRLVERVNRRLATPSPAERLLRELDEIRRPVEQKLKALQSDQLRALPVLRLESLERHWKFDAQRFERWQAEMNAATAPYLQLAAELTQRRTAWAATGSGAGAELLTPLLRERVDDSLSSLQSAEQALSGPLDRLIELRRQAGAVQSRIQAGTAEVAAAIADIDRRLLRLDVPPIWAVGPGERTAPGEVSDISQGLDIEMDFARAYGSAGNTNQKVLRALEILLLPLLLWLLHRSRELPALTDSAADTQRVLARPLSAWLLLSMMAVLALEPDAPLIAHETALLLALIPVLRLLPPRSRELLDAWPYVAIALYALDRAGVALIPGGYEFRLYQLGLTALALLLTLWLLYRLRRKEAASGGPLPEALRVIGRVGAALLAIALVANVAGNVSLAETLTSGVIDSGYLAIVLHAGVTVCLALWSALLVLPLATRLRLVRENAAALRALAAAALPLLAALGWLVYTMDRFRVLRPAHSICAEVLGHDFQVGELSISLGHLLVFALSVLIAFWSARIVRRLLRDELQDHSSLPRGVGNSVASLTYYAMLILGFFVALSAAGFKVSQLAIVFGALGVGIGFGLQNIVNNFVSGIVLMFERPIQPGDVIEVSGLTGRVRQIGMRATVLRTFDGADVVVPNGNLLNSNLTNWTLFDRNRRIEVEVPLDYGSDPAQVLPLLEAVARNTPGVALEPPPTALLKGYADSSLTFAVRAWTNDFDNWVTLRGELLSRTLKAVADAGLRIPYNQYDLNLRTVSEQASDALRQRPER